MATEDRIPESLEPHFSDPSTPVKTGQLLRIVAAERDYVDGQIGVLEERFRGIDRASALLSETVNRTPTEIQKEISHVESVMAERFAGVDTKFESIATQLRDRDRLSETQFKERDTRSEREARDNKLAVDAAFAAQEKQAVAQNEGNNLAINKSEASTAETIKTNQDLSRSEINSLRKSGEDQKQRQTEVDDDIKNRLGAIEAALVGIDSVKRNATEGRVESRAGSMQMIATLALIATLFGGVIGAAILKMLGG